MIKLNKQACPAILASNKESWTRELLDQIERGEKAPKHKADRYKHVDVKKAVVEDSFGKCIYCESKVTAIDFGDIEHIKPKSRYPEETYNWHNLGFVCAKCNNIKSDKYDESLPFVNPYVDDPQHFLYAMGPVIYRWPGNKRGEMTERGLELNRLELIEARKERLDAIRDLIDRLTNEIDPALQDILSQQIDKEIAEDKPYSMCAKSVVMGVAAGPPPRPAVQEVVD